MDLLQVLHNTVCGALAASGFGVLFNVGLRRLLWCAASGGLALALRTAVLGDGWSMEAASFVAALLLGFALELLPSQMADSRNALHVVGCIPMVPGGFATKAILGLFTITLQGQSATNETLINALDSTLRTFFILGALGTGLVIPTLVTRRRGTPLSRVYVGQHLNEFDSHPMKPPIRTLP